MSVNELRHRSRTTIGAQPSMIQRNTMNQLRLFINQDKNKPKLSLQPQIESPVKSKFDIVRQILRLGGRSKKEIYQLIDYFKDIHFFKTLKSYSKESEMEGLVNLFENAEYETISKGDVVFKENDESNGKMYVIITGEVWVVIKKLNYIASENKKKLAKRATQLQAQGSVDEKPSQPEGQLLLKQPSIDPLESIRVQRRGSRYISNKDIPLQMSPAKQQQSIFNRQRTGSIFLQPPNDDKTQQSGSTGGVQASPSQHRGSIFSRQPSDSSDSVSSPMRRRQGSIHITSEKTSIFSKKAKKSQFDTQNQQQQEKEEEEDDEDDPQSPEHLQKIVSKYGEYKDKIGAGSYFGDKALRSNRKRNATIIASEDCEFLVIKKEDFLPIQRAFDKQRENLLLFMKSVFPVEKIHASSLFEEFLYVLEEKVFQRGTLITEQGKHGNHFYLVYDGECAVTKNAVFDDSNNLVANLQGVKKYYKHTQKKGIVHVTNILSGTPFGDEILDKRSGEYEFNVKVYSTQAKILVVNKDRFQIRFPADVAAKMIEQCIAKTRQYAEQIVRKLKQKNIDLDKSTVMGTQSLKCKVQQGTRFSPNAHSKHLNLHDEVNEFLRPSGNGKSSEDQSPVDIFNTKEPQSNLTSALASPKINKFSTNTTIPHSYTSQSHSPKHPLSVVRNKHQSMPRIGEDGIQAGSSPEQNKNQIDSVVERGSGGSRVDTAILTGVLSNPTIKQLNHMSLKPTKAQSTKSIHDVPNLANLTPIAASNNMNRIQTTTSIMELPPSAKGEKGLLTLLNTSPRLQQGGGGADNGQTQGSPGGIFSQTVSPFGSPTAKNQQQQQRNSSRSPHGFEVVEPRNSQQSLKEVFPVPSQSLDPSYLFVEDVQPGPFGQTKQPFMTNKKVFKAPDLFAKYHRQSKSEMFQKISKFDSGNLDQESEFINNIDNFKNGLGFDEDTIEGKSIQAQKKAFLFKNTSIKQHVSTLKKTGPSPKVLTQRLKKTVIKQKERSLKKYPDLSTPKKEQEITTIPTLQQKTMSDFSESAKQFKLRTAFTSTQDVEIPAARTSDDLKKPLSSTVYLQYFGKKRHSESTLTTTLEDFGKTTSSQVFKNRLSVKPSTLHFMSPSSSELDKKKIFTRTTTSGFTTPKATPVSMDLNFLSGMDQRTISKFK